MSKETRQQEWLDIASEILKEAEQILSRYDGVHSAHGCVCNLRQHVFNIQEFGLEHDFNPDFGNMELMIRQLRDLDRTGFWPKPIRAEIAERLFNKPKNNETQRKRFTKTKN